jgi:hypothetical protein
MGSSTTGTDGAKPRLSEEQLAQFAQIVEAGQDREVDGVVRWRRIDLKRAIRRAVRRRLSSAVCRQTSAQARLLAHERKAPSSGAGRTDRRGVQKRMARPVCNRVCEIGG